MDVKEICDICFTYYFTGDATIFDYYAESSEEGTKLMEHVSDSLNSFIGEHQVIRQVLDDEYLGASFFSNKKCECCGCKAGQRFDVFLKEEVDPDEGYAEAIWVEMMEIPTDIMEEVRHDQ